VIPGVYIARDRDLLAALVAGEAEPLRIFAGYSGWGLVQLEAELDSGSWSITAATQDFVFGDSSRLCDHVPRHITDERLLGWLRVRPEETEARMPQSPETWNRAPRHSLKPSQRACRQPRFKLLARITGTVVSASAYLPHVPPRAVGEGSQPPPRHAAGPFEKQQIAIPRHGRTGRLPRRHRRLASNRPHRLGDAGP